MKKRTLTTLLLALASSILLAIPAVLASGIFQLAKSSDAGTLAAGPTIVATVTSFVVGYAVIVWFLKLISTKSYLPFVIYRLLLAAAVVALLGIGALSVY
mgnify:CR=1 FL=1